MSGVKVDPSFSAWVEALGPTPEPPKITTALEYRAVADAYIGSFLNFPIPGDVVETKHTICSYDGAEIDIYRFVRKDTAAATTAQPALVHVHGGGIVACRIESIGCANAAKLVSESGVQVFSVEYRVAPEFPYPIPVEDCYAALRWVSDHARELNIDQERIGIVGESGGACLAAGAAFLARDRGLSPPLAKQILIYPMLDHVKPWTAEVDSARGEYLSDYVNMLRICWSAYIGADTAGKLEAEVPSYAIPARAKDVSGLPSTYIDVGSLDLFRDESVSFAARLLAAGVDVELHLYEGVPHCFDLIAPDIQITRNAWENRHRAIRGI
ncbi:Carboxylesterase NlhH 1 [Pleurostoma richardsiae]|uniref:Carboxylesterase NlhH 1 n=1 Tax=Pleurostoma richardsiae TaxID=41990 RepID=A0AA38R1C7_9PEZI|nr:Carboxylesterase NlhH 1 [Pleurostoma richardsiae]